MSSSPTPSTIPYPTTKEELDEIIRKQLTLPRVNLVGRPYMRRLTGAELDNVKSYKVFLAQCGMGTIFITKDDQVFGIGKNSRNFNILGLTGRYYRCEEVDRPVRIEKLSGKCIQAIRVGGVIGAALDVEGKLYWWGQDLMQKNSVITPQLATDEKVFSYVSCGHCMMAALDKHGDVYIWGSSSTNGSPHLMEKLEVEGSIVGLSCGFKHLAMVTETGLVYTWGSGDEGQRGDGRGRQRSSSSHDDEIVKKIDLDFPCVAVICGTSATFFISISGELWACGGNGTGCGILGVANQQFEVYIPEKVLVPGDTIFHTAMWNSCGQTIYSALTTKGLYWWCERSYGCPGNETSRFAPDQTVAKLLNVFSSPHDSMIYVKQDVLPSSAFLFPQDSLRQPDISSTISLRIIKKLERIQSQLKACIQKSYVSNDNLVL